jgi:hypothetical protein
LGNIGTARSPLAVLAALLDRLGHYEPAATIADFAEDSVTRMSNYAFEQIDQARAQLNPQTTPT